MADVFVSYASSEKDKARVVAESLEAAGFSVWWDRALKPGETFDKVIQREIEQAKAIVVLWSKASVDSQWVREEADVGRQREALVPLLMDDVAPPIGFGRVQAAHLQSWDGDPKAPDWVEVVESVQRLVGRRATPLNARRRPQKSSRGGSPGRRWLIAGLAAAVLVLLGIVSILADGLKTMADPNTQAMINQINAAQQNHNAAPATPQPAAPVAQAQPQQIYTQPPQPAQAGVDPYAQALSLINPAAGQLQLAARQNGLTYACVTPQGWCAMAQPGPPNNACWCPNAYGAPVNGVTQ
ncbi:MAG: toll/interleukin-1 receptor domain-containing protein [Alphaproteobacteria bacterium]|nr:toll/interleukin-1 receptor domain-containing protein [Alphaproteobacteria bacterium]